MELDQIDLKILYYLRNNARISHTSLAKTLKLTSPAVKYRINNLEQRGVIKSYVTKIDKNILTPTYQSYLVSIKVNTSIIDEILPMLMEKRLFDRIFQIADVRNLIAITIPFSSLEMKKLIEILSGLNLEEYTITPIIADFENLDSQEIYGENIKKLHCPECQDIVNSNAFVFEINGSLFAFCCDQCRVDFSSKFIKILNK
jgi:DNA-binding Lrp family transcriptional regulator